MRRGRVGLIWHGNRQNLCPRAARLRRFNAAETRQCLRILSWPLSVPQIYRHNSVRGSNYRMENSLPVTALMLIIPLLGAAYLESWLCRFFVFFVVLLILKDQLGQRAFHHSYIIRDGTNMTFFSFFFSFHGASHGCHICKRREISSETYRAETSTVRFPSKPAQFGKPPGALSLLSVLRVVFFKLVLV